MSTPDSQWKIKPLLFFNLAALFVVASLWLPLTGPLWKIIDVAFFKWINQSLDGNPNWQIFWACANHKWADWVEDVVILGFFIAYVRMGGKTLRPKKIAELLFCVLYIAAILYFVNTLLFRETIKIPRMSPSLVVDSSIRLSELIPWMKIKDSATRSFPGDHATTAILFAASYAYLARGKLAVFACLYSIFLCMPRLITGAHWLSDILIGSGAIALIFLSWAFCSPLFNRFVTLTERLFTFNRRKPMGSK